MITEALIRNQINKVTFVMVDSANTEVAGLGGGGLTVAVSKNGAAFAPSAGTKAEISSGWYYYDLTAGECDTIGPLSVKVTGAGCVQQNLEYVVQQRTPSSTLFPYTLTSSVPPNPPIQGAHIWISTDLAGNNVIWVGDTDAFGVARDEDGIQPYLDPGTYYIWAQKEGWTPSAFPDIETHP